MQDGFKKKAWESKVRAEIPEITAVNYFDSDSTFAQATFYMKLKRGDRDSYLNVHIKPDVEPEEWMDVIKREIENDISKPKEGATEGELEGSFKREISMGYFFQLNSPDGNYHMDILREASNSMGSHYGGFKNALENIGEIDILKFYSEAERIQKKEKAK